MFSFQQRKTHTLNFGKNNIYIFSDNTFDQWIKFHICTGSLTQGAHSLVKKRFTSSVNTSDAPTDSMNIINVLPHTSWWRGFHRSYLAVAFTRILEGLFGKKEVNNSKNKLQSPRRPTRRVFSSSCPFLPPLWRWRRRRFVRPRIVVELVASVVAVAVALLAAAAATVVRVVWLIHAVTRPGRSSAILAMFGPLIIVAGIVWVAGADVAKVFVLVAAAGLLLVSRLRSRLQPGHLICGGGGTGRRKWGGEGKRNRISIGCRKKSFMRLF